jgi:nucleotide-binding universal stress UspA family protein
VIATFGKTGWRRFAIGSVTEKVVRLASCQMAKSHADNRTGRFSDDGIGVR